MQTFVYTPLDPQLALGQPGDAGLTTAQSTMTIARNPEELYTLWRDLELIPRWQERIVQVADLGNGRSRWTMAISDEKTVDWYSQLVIDEPDRIGWRTEEGTEVQLAGQVIFEPALNGRGTVVRVTQQFRLPGGKFASFFSAPHLRSPDAYVRENLRHFKQLAEAGEIARSNGQSHGSSNLRGDIMSILLGEQNETGERTTAA